MIHERLGKLHVLFPLLSRKTVENRIVEMADSTVNRHRDDNPIYVRVENGANYFADQLEMRFEKLRHGYETGTIAVHSMSGANQGEIELAHEYTGPDIKDKNIIIVEDIVDSGKTVEWLIKHFNDTFSPAMIEVIALYSKPEGRKVDVPLKDIGFDVWGFVVGSNLDYDQKYRKLGGLYVVKFLTQVFTNPKEFFYTRMPAKKKSI